MIFLKRYKVREVAKDSFSVSLPPSFTEPNEVKKGTKLACYLTKRGEVIYRKIDGDEPAKMSENEGEIFVRSYLVQSSGERGLSVSLPPIFRDRCRIKNGNIISCYLARSEILFRKGK